MTGLWISGACARAASTAPCSGRALERAGRGARTLRSTRPISSTIETLVEELGQPGSARTCLRDRHARDARQAAARSRRCCCTTSRPTCARVRSRPLEAAKPRRRSSAGCPGVERMLKDPSPRGPCGRRPRPVGHAARGLCRLMRPYLDDRDPRMVVTAAMALAASPMADDVRRQKRRCGACRKTRGSRPRQPGARSRRGSRHIRNPRFRELLVPLMYDPVARRREEAIKSAGLLGRGDYLFVPSLLALMRNRLFKSAARGVLVGYGPGDPRHAGVRPARRGRGHLGPPEHSVNAGPDPDAAIDGPAGRRAG